MKPDRDADTLDGQVDERIAAQIAAFDAGDLTGDARAEIEALLARSEAARATLARLRAVRRMTATLPPPTLPPEVRRAIGDRAGDEVRRRARRRSVGWALAAAAGLAGGILAPRLMPRPRPSPPAPPAAQLLRTGPGEHQLLPIGERALAFVSEQTEVELYRDPARPIRLRRGALRLVVQRDPRAPFVVATPVADVAVLGTEFDVHVGPDGRAEVNVVRGVVEVRNALGSRRLWAKEGARVLPGEGPRMFVPVRGLVDDGPAEIVAPR